MIPPGPCDLPFHFCVNIFKPVYVDLSILSKQGHLVIQIEVSDAIH